MSSLTSEILFEKFQILEVLKKDEHAAVFLANHIYLSKKIILKVLNTQKMPDPSIVARFKREAKILAQLDHPNIIKVLDFGMSKEFFYISFEYIEGDSLRNVFKTKTLTLEQKEHLMIQLLKGLDYAHNNQIIHRDIKPENIFIDKNLNVKLGDFGLALSAEENFITNPYSIVGTPSYMSPEQVRGAKLTPPSDLFSAGVVFFEMFSGKNPFLKENVSLTLNEIMSYDDKNLDESLAAIPENVREILRKLLKKNISQRYLTAEEILIELNVNMDQPTLIVNNIDREGRKSKLAWIFIAFIVLGAAAVFVVEKYTGADPAASSGQITNADTARQAATPENNSRISADPKNNETKDSKAAEKNITPIINDVKGNSAVNDQKQNNTTEISKKSFGYGAIFVDCRPYGKIYLNGQEYDTTPLRSPIKVPEGEYSLKLVHPDYPPYYTTISVKAEQTTKFNFSFDSKMGFINCRVYPWGDVFINGVKKGEAPSPNLIKVNPGFITLSIQNPNYKNIDTNLNVHEGDTLRLNFKFKK